MHICVVEGAAFRDFEIGTTSFAPELFLDEAARRTLLLASMRDTYESDLTVLVSPFTVIRLARMTSRPLT
jgi:hypothetical protein